MKASIYAPAWIAIKKKGTVTLKVAPHLSSRVKKAVIKQKDQDITFKFENEVKKLRLTITYDAKTWMMVFVLRPVQTVGIGEL